MLALKIEGSLILMSICSSKSIKVIELDRKEGQKKSFITGEENEPKEQ